MPANPNSQPALDDNVQMNGSAASATLDATIEDLKERAAKVAQETLESIRVHAKPYMEDAGEQLEVAERFIVERVQKQPLTTTLAVLGVGVLIGLVLGSGRSR
jgi:hypothetical protein